MKQALQITTRQQLKMTPQLQQAIELLQLSALELEERVKQAIEANPMLEVIETNTADTDLPIQTDWKSAEIEHVYSQSVSNSGMTDDLTSLSSSEVTLQEHLLWQLNLTPFSDLDSILALTIIDSIREDGYLSTTLDEMLIDLKSSYPEQLENLEISELEAVLHRVQQFDPLGVASRNLKECLLLQLNAVPEHLVCLSVAKELVDQYLEVLAKKNYSEIINKMCITELQFTTALKIIKQLYPNPGDLITNKQPEYIVPDVMLIKQQNIWQVSLAKDLRENIRINTDYSRLVKNNNNIRDAEYLRTQLSEAKWLLNGIQNRNNTLLKVASCIIDRQRDFLERGDEYMRPMVLQDIALETGFNESTISRVTTKKYIHTPRGIFELKYFFSGHLTNMTGNDCSSIAIKAIIRQLISKEAAQTPLSDQAISALMQNQGLKVARRTIAKYRESLGIGSSSQRKNK